MNLEPYERSSLALSFSSVNMLRPDAHAGGHVGDCGGIGEYGDQRRQSHPSSAHRNSPGPPPHRPERAGPGHCDGSVGHRPQSTAAQRTAYRGPFGASGTRAWRAMRHCPPLTMGSYPSLPIGSPSFHGGPWVVARPLQSSDRPFRRPGPRGCGRSPPWRHAPAPPARPRRPAP